MGNRQPDELQTWLYMLSSDSSPCDSLDGVDGRPQISFLRLQVVQVSILCVQIAARGQRELLDNVFVGA